MSCEIEKLTGKKCNNDAYANITVSGSKGSIDVEGFSPPQATPF